MLSKLKIQFGRVDSVGETPGYISNPEVKSDSGEGSARGTLCENSETRPLYIKKARSMSGLFLYMLVTSIAIITRSFLIMGNLCAEKTTMHSKRLKVLSTFEQLSP